MAGWSGGVFTRFYNWVADAAAGNDIEASRFDSENDTFAAGINNCLTKDGQNSPTANLPMNSKKHTGVAASSARTDYARVAELQDGVHTWEATDGGAADAYTITPAPPITAYAAGQQFQFIPANDNTGASTLAVSGLAAKDIKLADGTDPAAGDIDASGIAQVQYDGTNFVLINPAIGGGTLLGTVTATTSGTAVDYAPPSSARAVIINFSGVSVDASATYQLLLGTGSSPEGTGYVAHYGQITGLNNCSVVASTTYFPIVAVAGADETVHGTITLTLLDSSTNTWSLSGTLTSQGSSVRCAMVAGSKSLAGVLDLVRIKTVGGDTFDAGKVNVQYRR